MQVDFMHDSSFSELGNSGEYHVVWITSEVYRPGIVHKF